MTSTLNSPRIRMDKVSPEVYEAMMALSIASAKDVEPSLAELIKIRASQLNHCAFCLDMHTHDARKQGETEQRIYLLNAWAEAGIFTPTGRRPRWRSRRKRPYFPLVSTCPMPPMPGLLPSSPSVSWGKSSG